MHDQDVVALQGREPVLQAILVRQREVREGHSGFQVRAHCVLLSVCGLMPATSVRSRYTLVSAVTYRSRESEPPKARLCGASGSSIRSSRSPAAEITQIPPGPQT